MHYPNQQPHANVVPMEHTCISTGRINVERVSVTSRKSLQEVLSKFDAAVGHPDIQESGSVWAPQKRSRKWKSWFSRRLDHPDSWSLPASIMAESCTKDKAATIQKFFDLSSAIR